MRSRGPQPARVGRRCQFPLPGGPERSVGRPRRRDRQHIIGRRRPDARRAPTLDRAPRPRRQPDAFHCQRSLGPAAAIGGSPGRSQRAAGDNPAGLAHDDADRGRSTARSCLRPARFRATAGQHRAVARMDRRFATRGGNASSTDPCFRGTNKKEEVARRGRIPRHGRGDPGERRLEPGPGPGDSYSAAVARPAYGPGAGSCTASPRRRAWSSKAFTDEAAHCRPPRGVRSRIRSS